MGEDFSPRTCDDQLSSFFRNFIVHEYQLSKSSKKILNGAPGEFTLKTLDAMWAAAIYDTYWSLVHHFGFTTQRFLLDYSAGTHGIGCISLPAPGSRIYLMYESRPLAAWQSWGCD